MNFPLPPMIVHVADLLVDWDLIEDVEDTQRELGRVEVYPIDMIGVVDRVVSPPTWATWEFTVTRNDGKADFAMSVDAEAYEAMQALALFINDQVKFENVKQICLTNLQDVRGAQ